ncbi:MAG TPA: Zn-dependent hydrolase [Thermomicrobiales bacterium]|nr:Zn-dependent hydrolase [Thermomicrobiales bacterium]
MVQIEIDPAVVEERIMSLGAIGACHETGVCRAALTPEWIEAQQLVERWCQEAGLATRMDAVANLWGRVEGTEGGKAVVSGSHIDSQMPGGRYDGALGIIAALTAVEALLRQFGPPKRPLEVLSFCEEEGSRFNGARFWGSRGITGAIAPGDADAIMGYDGVSLADAMRAIGLDPADIPSAVRHDIEAFIELHIEQGPVLELEDLPVGVVNIINGSKGYNVTVTGETNHAGARPMDTRRDALVGVAEMILAVNSNAVAMGRPAVSTVGRVAVEPNLGPAVPGKVTFTIDCRHNDPAKLEELATAHEAAITRIAKERDLEISWTSRPPLPPCPCDPEVVRVLEDSAREQGIPALTMPSGALHDTQRMANVTRVAMVFVRSKDGRSHTPEEFTSVEDAVAGIRVLAGALHALAY